MKYIIVYFIISGGETDDRGDKGDIEGKRKMADMVDRAVSSKKVLKVLKTETISE